MIQNTRWTARAYAKINLGLHVNARLDNGYHDITTGFAFIDWSDRFEVQESDRHRIEMKNTDIEAGPGNLVNRAIELFDLEVGLKSHWHITVEKQIPAGAGLGGGSSDAALTLRMMNQLEGHRLSDSELAEIGATLGSDIPLFIYNKTAIGTGTGTDLAFVDIQPKCWIITVFAGIHSSTAEAYRYCEPNSMHDFDLTRILQIEPIEEWKYLVANDLEPQVVALHSMVGNVKDQLYEDGASFALMSGSGSAVYGLFEQEFVANQSLRGFLEAGMQAKITAQDFKPDTNIYELV
ncbi:MAG TPA: 4-(cytidine 5'-diphospho)-2-C-methyl-D-erythritol kinase [Balneolales bacterium]|nr:4-(cytidine 5'-diphospho)-2-C-methyl-D-erythritol kinase [Balneolales bacterium]